MPSSADSGLRGARVPALVSLRGIDPVQLPFSGPQADHPFGPVSSLGAGVLISFICRDVDSIDMRRLMAGSIQGGGSRMGLGDSSKKTGSLGSGYRGRPSPREAR